MATPALLVRFFVALMATAWALQDLTHGTLLSTVAPSLEIVAALAVGLRAIQATVEARDLAVAQRAG